MGNRVMKTKTTKRKKGLGKPLEVKMYRFIFSSIKDSVGISLRQSSGRPLFTSVVESIRDKVTKATTWIIKL